MKFLGVSFDRQGAPCRMPAVAHQWICQNLTYLLTYNLASLSGPNSARARTQLTLSLMKQFRSNRLTLH